MKLEIVTTIRTYVDVETFETDHTAEIDAGGAEGLPVHAILATVVGACRSTIKSVEKELGRDEKHPLTESEDDSEPASTP